MRPLKIVLLGSDPERFRGALTIAAAHAALGGKVAVFFQLEAVALLKHDNVAPKDSAHHAKGLPRLAELMHDAAELGVTFIACQSGMELCGMEAGDLPAGTMTGGPVSFLQSVMAEDRLILL